MTNQITLTVDGIEVSVPKGTVVVEAARKLGNEIPVFCYHTKMSKAGVCRMCLVEVGVPAVNRATREPELDEEGKPVIRFFPKAMPACQTVVSPGMQIKTSSEKVMAKRKAILEFLLTSHPLDCPVCDKGGECPLQDLTLLHGPTVSRFDYDDKKHLPKKQPLGDLIMLDMERCIICTRCVRFQEEVAHDPVLAVGSRGNNAHIISYSDPIFDSHYSGNTTDICPVGALTTRDFRFGARSWELTNVPSICNHCGVGCNTVLGIRTGQIKRLMPRQNEAVNEIWLCDKGRFGHHFTSSDNRLMTPLIRKEGQLVEAGWDEALELIARQFTTIKDNNNSDALAGLAGVRLSNEDLYLFQKLFREVIGTNNIDHRVGLSAAIEDETVYTVGVGVGTDLGNIGLDTTILVIGSDLDQEAPVLYLRIAATSGRGINLINAGGRPVKLDGQAKTSLRYNYGTAAYLALGLAASVIQQGLVAKEWLEAHATGFAELEEFLQEYTPDKTTHITGLAVAEVEAAAKSYAESENGIILFGLEAGNDPALRAALESLALITGHAGRPNNGIIVVLPHVNSRGAADMGIVPNRLPGYTLVKEGTAGLSTFEILSGGTGVKGMLIAGADPAPENETYRNTLDQLDFLVVQDLFLTETAKLADVVLPALGVTERDGTFTNLERRVQTFDIGVSCLGQGRADWLILTAIACSMGAEWDYASADGVMDEITRELPLYAGMKFENLTASISLNRKTGHYIYNGLSFTSNIKEGTQWPTLAETEGKPSIKLRFIAPKSPPDGDGLILATPRFLYDGGRVLAESEIMQAYITSPQLLLSSSDAQNMGLVNGDKVTVSQNGSSVSLPVHINGLLSDGTALLPRNLSGHPAEKLAGATGSVRVKVKKT